jgi:hypothetical protein
MTLFEPPEPEPASSPPAPYGPPIRTDPSVEEGKSGKKERPESVLNRRGPEPSSLDAHCVALSCAGSSELM